MAHPHGRRYTTAGVQCECGSNTWSLRHVVAYEYHYLREYLPYWLRKAARHTPKQHS